MKKGHCYKMIRLGEMQTLKIVKKVEFGVYLSDDGQSVEERKKQQPGQASQIAEKVLLPAKQVPKGAEIGDKVKVFIYRDSKDRLIATTFRPLIMLGDVARLRVVQTGKIGAFLDWGLEKDLLLPFKEQKKRVKEGESCLVALYIDKSGRLCATMNVYRYLRQDSPYKKDDRVTGTVYEISDNFGAFVAVDDIYSGLIAKKELYGDVQVGGIVEARVVEVKEDGRLDLSIREKAYLQIEQDAEKILKVIDSYDGALPFTDKASPETIKREMQMSKNEFKRAVGHLLKEKKITIGERAIRKL